MKTFKTTFMDENFDVIAVTTWHNISNDSDAIEMVKKHMEALEIPYVKVEYKRDLEDEYENVSGIFNRLMKAYKARVTREAPASPY